jgi:tetratricopeptide (TPR) repeat protein
VTTVPPTPPLAVEGHQVQQWYSLRDVLAMYPGLREDHLRYLQKWNLVRPALRTQAGTYFAFTDLVVIRQAHAELARGAAFRAVLRALQSSHQGQMSLDFSLDASPAKVIGLRPKQAAGHASAPPAGVRHADSAAAEEYFRDGSKLDDGDPRKHEAASRAYRRALELDPCLVPAIINLANIHYAREHLIEAEVLYDRAIALQPDLFEAHFNLGNVFHDLGRLDEARACYEEALRLNPEYPEAHFYLAVTLEKQGFSALARPHWRRYRDLAPDGEWVELAREFSDQP